jgi:hypothetical protein
MIFGTMKGERCVNWSHTPPRRVCGASV